jgi:S1-C subfamily serine protease
MHKIIALLFLGLLVVGCSSHNLPPPKIAQHEVFDHITRSTVAFVAKGENDHIHLYCSGVWISHNQILTASHCMEGYAKHISSDTLVINPLGLYVRYATDKEIVGIEQDPTKTYNAKSIKIDINHDLAIVETVDDIPEHDVVALASTTPPVGSTVFNVGHTNGMFYTAKNGIVASYRNKLPEDTRTLHYMQIYMQLFGGDSGSGIFNESGELVAIAESINHDVPLASFCIPLDILEMFLHAEEPTSPHLDKPAP